MKKPIVLIIMDGWGIAKANKGNAVALAKTPNLDKLYKTYPNTTLQAHGRCVGLPMKQDGNSEAGHMNLGAGRSVDQDAVKINRAINTGIFAKNPAFLEAVGHVQENKSKLHLMGLLTGEMSAHAFPDHLYVLMAFAQKHKIQPIYLHLFTDGRDSAQHQALILIKELQKTFKNGEIIASIMGRYYAMERNKRWPITKKAYELLTEGKGLKADNSEEAIVAAYNREETDEFIKPTLLDKNGLIEDNDAVIYFNLRSDRARQLSKAFVQKRFKQKNKGAFKRQKHLKNLRFIAMTDFGPDLDHILAAFPSEDIKQTLPMLLKNKKQLYLAESEKYAHVTYFFNGGYADPVNGEERIMIPSPDCEHYDKKPEMSAPKITKALIENIKNNIYDFYCVNYANPDMVAHTGNLKAGIKACECVDKQIGQVVKEVLKKKGVVLITADHGNAEEMVNLKTGEIDTKHSTNPVPLIITDRNIELNKSKNNCLGHIAPSILKLFDLKKSDLMDQPLW